MTFSQQLLSSSNTDLAVMCRQVSAQLQALHSSATSHLAEAVQCGRTLLGLDSIHCDSNLNLLRAWWR